MAEAIVQDMKTAAANDCQYRHSTHGIPCIMGSVQVRNRYGFQMIRTAFFLCLLLPSMLSAQTGRPNFLIIVADDVGMAELGPYGSEIDTPALDALAAEGIRFTNFYAQMNCSPTRAMLMSGTDNHLAGLGTMGAGMQSPNQEGVPGYEGVLNDRVVTFAKLLQDNGYRTYATGKWHLGVSPDNLPIARGFDQSFIPVGRRSRPTVTST